MIYNKIRAKKAQITLKITSRRGPRSPDQPTRSPDLWPDHTPGYPQITRSKSQIAKSKRQIIRSPDRNRRTRLKPGSPPDHQITPSG